MEKNKFTLRYGYQPEWTDSVVELFNKTQMKRNDSEKVNRCFSKSQVVISLWKENSIIAIGRMLTDFEMYSSIFDLVVDPKFQQRGIGKQILTALIETVPGSCIYLTSTLGNEAFYLKQGFKFHKSALALFPKSYGKTPYLDWDRLE